MTPGQQLEARMPQIFSDVACTVCGCVCDDLRVTVSGNRISHVEGACKLAEPCLRRCQIHLFARQR